MGYSYSLNVTHVRIACNGLYAHGLINLHNIKVFYKDYKEPMRQSITIKCQIIDPGYYPSKHLKTCHHRRVSETPFYWRFAGGPMVARYCVLAAIPSKRNIKGLLLIGWNYSPPGIGDEE